MPKSSKDTNIDIDVDQFVIVATCGKFVNIIERQTKHTILVDASYIVVNAEISTSGEASYVVVNTVDHRLWRVNLTDSIRSYSECSEKLQHEEHMNSEDIFCELLCPSNDTLTSHTDQFPASIDPNVINISVKAHDLLYTSDNPILHFALWDGWVAMLVEEDSGGASLSMCRIEDYPDAVRAYKQLKVLQRISLIDSADQLKGDRWKKQLYFVLQRETTSDSHQPSSSSSIHLPKSLFTSVFGREATLLNSPVLLVCANSGCVQSYAVKQVTAKSLGPRPRVVCHLHSPIVNICQVSVKRPDKTREPNLDAISALSSALQAKSGDAGNFSPLAVSVLFVSVTGECCMIVSSTEELSSPEVLLFSLPSSINSCITHGDLLVYSTGHSVEACELKLCKVPGNSHFSVMPDCRTLSRKSQISRLVMCSSKDHKSEDDYIIAVTDDLNITEISLVQSAESETDSHSLSDIPHIIERCTDQIRDIKVKSSAIDSFILQMNILASLKQSLTQTKDVPTESIVTCSCYVVSNVNGYSRDWKLKTLLTNKSSVSLSNDWTLIVAMTSQGLSRHHEKCISETHALPLLRGLGSNSKLDFTFPLDSLIQGKCYPKLQVSISLALQFKNFDFLPDLYKDQCQKAISVHLCSQPLDILNFLRQPNMDVCSTEVSNVCSPEVSSLNEASLSTYICQLAEQKVKGCLDSDSQMVQNLTLKIGISKSVAEKLGSPRQVLEVLLARETSSLTSCQLQAPAGTPVTVSVTSAQEEKDLTSLSSALSHVLTLTSSDAILLCEIRDAIKSKLGTKKKVCEKLKSRSKSDLQEMLNSAEQVKEFICQCQGQSQSSNGISASVSCDMINKFESIDCLI